MAAPQVGILFFEGQSNFNLTSAPTYLKSLENNAWTYNTYSGTTQPSLPDYCMISSGSWLGKQGSDNGPGYFAANNNIMAQVAADSRGLTWKTYAEGSEGNYSAWVNADAGLFSDAHSGRAPGSLTTAGHAHYSAHHDIGALFSSSSIKAAGVGGASGRYDFNQLNADVTAKNLPNFFFISPNNNNSGHDLTTTTGPPFLDTFIKGGSTNSDGTIGPDHDAAGYAFPGIAALMGAMQSNGLFFISFDNDGSNFYTICIGPSVVGNTPKTGSFNHAHMLVAIQNLFGFPKFTTPSPLPANYFAVESVYTSAPALPIPSVVVTTPVRSLNPVLLAFPTTNPGSVSPAQSVTISNTGGGTLSGTASLTGANPGKFRIITSPTTYSVTSTGAVFSVTFNPASTDPGSSNFTATLAFTDNAPGSPASVPLSGTVTPTAGNAAVSPAALSFNVQAGSTSAAQTVTVTNNGGSSLTINSATATPHGLVLSGANASQFAISVDGLSGQAIAVGANKTCSVTFSPPAGSSTTASAVLTITDSTGTAQTQPVTLTGVPLSGSPIGTVSPASQSFGSIVTGSSSANFTFTLTNTGGNPSTLSVTAVALAGTSPGQFAIVSDTGQTSLGFGALRTVVLRFSPTSTGAKTATLQFTDNTGGVNGTNQSITLTGTGVTPGVPIVTVTPPSPEQFPNTVIGQTSTQIVTVTNSGAGNLIITSAVIGTSSSG